VYDALFLKPTTNATAVPRRAMGNHGTASQRQPSHV
jgi:hypothetical protein